MKRLVFAAVTVAMFAGPGTGRSHAMDPSDYMGLSPEQMQGVIDNQRAYDEMNLRAVIEMRRQEQEAIRERNRQIEYQNRNPFGSCVSLGEVKGKSVDEAISLGKKIGGTNIQYVETTADYVRANIYKCPQQQQ